MGFWVIFLVLSCFAGRVSPFLEMLEPRSLSCKKGRNMPYDRFYKTFPVSLTVWPLRGPKVNPKIKNRNFAIFDRNVVGDG